MQNLLCGASSSSRWYVVRTLARQEIIAEMHLNRQGFKTFLPRIVATLRHARKLERRKIALFPRYEFVMLDVERQRWRSVNGTFGVESLLMISDRPAAVPTAVVDELLAAADHEGVIDSDHGLTPGSRIRLVDGPFFGALGTLIKLNENGRVDLLLQLVNGSVRVNVAKNMLRSLPDAPYFEATR